jgi:hypothetical protein
LLGLLVLWITLVLMFKAHTLSDAYLIVGGTTSQALSEMDRGLAPGGNARDKLMLPISMSWGGVSPRQALNLIAAHVGFDLQIDGVENRLDDRRRKIQLENLPLYRAIHRLLGRPDVGYGLRNGRHLLIFAQAMRIEEEGALPKSLEWSAELPLSLQPLIVSPAENADLQLSLYLRGQTDEAGVAGERVAVELWEGPTWLAMTHVELNGDGDGEVSLSNFDYLVKLRLARVRSASTDGPNRYRVELTFHENKTGLAPASPASAVQAPGAPAPAPSKDSLKSTKPTSPTSGVVRPIPPLVRERA